MQPVEHFKSFIGQKVTASINYKNLVEDVSRTTVLAVFDGITTSQVILSSSEGISKITHQVSNSATMLVVQVMTTSNAKNCSLTPIWCKLEVGENATAFMPRHPSEELWLCQRYYQNIKLEGQTGCVASVAIVQPVLVLSNNLRTKPTIQMVKYPVVIGQGIYYNCIYLFW